MSDTTFAWAIANLERSVSDGKVTVAHYTVRAKSGDGAYSSGAYGSLGFDGDIATPFSKLTEADVIGWVKDVLGDEKVAEIETALQAQLDEQRAPSKAAGVPWASFPTAKNTPVAKTGTINILYEG
jgi:hypothetical protein